MQGQIAERPVFHIAMAISSVIAASSFFTTSTRIGSNVRMGRGSFVRFNAHNLSVARRCRLYREWLIESKGKRR